MFFQYLNNITLTDSLKSHCHLFFMFKKKSLFFLTLELIDEENKLKCHAKFKSNFQIFGFQKKKKKLKKFHIMKEQFLLNLKDIKKLR